MFVEKSGLGPSDGVKISVDTSGKIEIVTGGASLGQGFETVIAQVCAETLGVDYRNIRVVHGQTDRIAFGIGAHASRATVMTASATHNAALAVRQQGARIRRRVAAGAGRMSFDRRRQRRSNRSQGRSFDEPGRDCRRAVAGVEDTRCAGAGTVGRRLVPRRAPGLSLWQPCGDGSRRRRYRRGDSRALRHRLRHRPCHQSCAGEGPDRRRIRARTGRNAVRGVSLQ